MTLPYTYVDTYFFCYHFSNSILGALENTVYFLLLYSSLYYLLAIWIKTYYSYIGLRLFRAGILRDHGIPFDSIQIHLFINIHQSPYYKNVGF